MTETLSSERKARILSVGLPVLVVAVAVVLFVPVFSASDGSGERVGGGSIISDAFTGRSGWDSRGYYSQVVAIPGVGELKPGTVVRGPELANMFASAEQFPTGYSPFDGALAGDGQGAATQKPKPKPADKPKTYGSGDVVSYTVTSVNKSGDTATVSGTATMSDGTTQSGSVYLRKVDGKWKVVGYSVG